MFLESRRKKNTSREQTLSLVRTRNGRTQRTTRQILSVFCYEKFFVLTRKNSKYLCKISLKAYWFYFSSIRWIDLLLPAKCLTSSKAGFMKKSEKLYSQFNISQLLGCGRRELMCKMCANYCLMFPVDFNYVTCLLAKNWAYLLHVWLGDISDGS